jgi:hypothetical protein
MQRHFRPQNGHAQTTLPDEGPMVNDGKILDKPAEREFRHAIDADK